MKFDEYQYSIIQKQSPSYIQKTILINQLITNQSHFTIFMKYSFIIVIFIRKTFIKWIKIVIILVIYI